MQYMCGFGYIGEWAEINFLAVRNVVIYYFSMT